MAKRIKTVTTEEDLTQNHLVDLITALYAENGLRIYNGQVFDASDLRKKLHDLLCVRDVSDKEMIDAHRTILGRWCHQNNFPLNFKFEFKDISESGSFVLTFPGIEIIKPIKSEDKPKPSDNNCFLDMSAETLITTF